MEIVHAKQYPGERKKPDNYSHAVNSSDIFWQTFAQRLVYEKCLRFQFYSWIQFCEKKTNNNNSCFVKKTEKIERHMGGSGGGEECNLKSVSDNERAERIKGVNNACSSANQS